MSNSLTRRTISQNILRSHVMKGFLSSSILSQSTSSTDQSDMRIYREAVEESESDTEDACQGG